jgi:hypothetical protein
MKARRAGVLVIALASCGLVSRDVTKVSFDLPPKSYAFDTHDWQLPSGSFPRVACGTGEPVVDCCDPPPPAPRLDCAALPLTCESGACTLRFPVSAIQRVNLAVEAPALANVGNQSLVDFFVSDIRYTVASTMNVELPAVDLYVAPDGVTSAADPSARKFATVPVTPAMANGDGSVDISPDAEQIFAPYAHAPATPFNFIATATVVIPSGSPIPNGRVDLTVTGQVSAILAPL